LQSALASRLKGKEPADPWFVSFGIGDQQEKALSWRVTPGTLSGRAGNLRE